MSYDISRIHNIENLLKSQPTNISTNDLIYFLKYNTKNQILDPNNLNKTEEYLRKINNSFFYENIFINTSNYTNTVSIFIGLLIPFYFFYPRFYSMGFIGYAIGISSLLSLYFIINNLYSNFYGNVGNKFIVLTVLIYLIFFILLNKLNHISLLFISAIISYLILNYYYRVSLLLPTSSNIYNQYRASINNRTDYTQYNLLTESACFEIIRRYNLKLPSGNMLYSYLTVFDIGTNENKIIDFVTNLFGPFVSLSILYLLGNFLSKIEDSTILYSSDKIKLFPIVGINPNSSKYYTCEANYILPKELNVNLLINDLIDKYGFNDALYDKVYKALLRISKELLLKYNPKFMNIDNLDKKIIYQNLKDNKIFIRINKLLKKNYFEFNLDYIDEIKKYIENENIEYNDKVEMYNLLEKIDNTLLIVNEINEKYEEDSILAKDELLYDKEIKEEYKDLMKDITDKYIKNFTDNLNLKENLLFGYDYNISFYSLFGQKIRLYSNKILNIIISLLSVWILFAKPFGTPYLLCRYILTQNHGFKDLLNNLSGKSIIWKYFSMGLDTSYFEEIFKKVKNNSESSIIEKGLNILYTILLFIILFPIIYFYNSINFGFTLSPSWYNLLYQFVFILNIACNLYCYYYKKSYLVYNIGFLISFIIVFIVISVILYVINSLKK
jgi:hypothetical protein